MLVLPRAPRSVDVMTPRCLLVEPHLTRPIRRPRSPLEPVYGFVLLLAADDAYGVWGALREIAGSWAGGITSLRQGAIAHPLQPLDSRQVDHFGPAYVNGFQLRVETSARPAIFGPANTPVPPRKLASGSWVECALQFYNLVTRHGLPGIGVDVEWIDVYPVSRSALRTAKPPMKALT